MEFLLALTQKKALFKIIGNMIVKDLHIKRNFAKVLQLIMHFLINLFDF